MTEMPKVRELSKLFQAVSQSDFSTAEEIAKQMAILEEKKGHYSAAELLRGSLNRTGIKGHRASDPVILSPSNGSFLDAAITRGRAQTTLEEVMLRRNARVALNTLIAELQHARYLSSKGIRRRSKILFVGPPGCGKSVTAQAVANKIGLPLYIVRFDSVIGAYLGQTATHLRELFRFATTHACVLLFDEIDALGKQRGNPLDVGELDRIVIALMQELEFLETSGIVIATSNLPQNLDRALWRRFDLVLHFPKPSRTELVEYSRKIARRFDLSNLRVPAEVRRSCTTYAEAEKAVEAEARRIALKDLSHR